MIILAGACQNLLSVHHTRLLAVTQFCQRTEFGAKEKEQQELQDSSKDQTDATSTLSSHLYQPMQASCIPTAMAFSVFDPTESQAST